MSRAHDQQADSQAALRALREALEAVSRLASLSPSYFSSTAPRAGAEPITRTQDYAELCRIWEERRGSYASQMVHRSCPTCSETVPEPMFVSQDGFPFVRCRSCAMWYASRVLPDEVWAAYQRDEPRVVAIHDRQFAQGSSAERLSADRERFERYLDALCARVPQRTLDGLSYVDIGCFTGNSLRFAAERGMHAFGIENSERAVAYAHAHGLHDRVHRAAKGLEGRMAGRLLDVAGLWETLEHHMEPRSTLRTAATLLRSGGLLGLTVPNAHSTLPLMLREYCFFAVGGADAQGHINLYSIETLKRSLEEEGFALVFWETHYSTDWRQILLYLSGHLDSVYCPRNVASGTCLRFEMPTWIADFSNAIGPELSRLETMAGAGPMIFAVAEKRR